MAAQENGRICFQIEAPIAPRWPNIELLRSSVLNCLATIFQDNAFCQSVSMITSELLENAVKYGDWEGTDRHSFKLRVAGSADSVEVHVSNPVSETAPDLKQLMETVTFIKSFETPRDAYHERLRQIAAHGADGSSRLGLSRVAYEGNCTIDAEVVEGILHVRTLSRQ